MEYVTTGRQLEEVGRAAASAGMIAADTEAAGYHRYRDTVCLLQVSTRERTWVVDTLELRDLSPLVEPLADEGIEVVFHDADYDLRLLHRDFGVEVRGLFDTKIAAELLGEPGLGLASLLERHVGLTIPKKYQRADWAKRPLPADMLEYAAEDTRHLARLRDAMRAELEAKGRLHWAEEEFRLRERTLWEDVPEEDTFRVKGSRDLNRRQLGALRELYEWREALAEERDQASFRVMSNNELVLVARALPRTRADLVAAGLSEGNARRWGRELLDAVRRANELSEDQLPEKPKRGRREPHDPEMDERVERMRKTRDLAAGELGLDKGLLLPRHMMESIARAKPRDVKALRAVDGLRNWQVEVLGERLLEALGR
ncbi:MAG TPA: ribonuclease D [Longimicrobiales bacterium]